MDAFAKILGGAARLKLLRLFLFNPGNTFAKEEVIQRLKISPKSATREVGLLEKSGLIKRKMVTLERPGARGVRKVRAQGWIVDQAFPFFPLLQRFLIDTTLLEKDEIVARLRSAGRIDLLVVSGVFAKHWEARLDLLVVGSRLKEATLEEGIKGMEAELGRELHYAVLSTEEFYYRRSIQDRLIRDVMDFPHEVLIDRVGLR